jgi:hypothetical protein
VTFRYSRPQPGVEYTDSRQARLEQGCVIVSDVRAAADDRGVVVELQSMARR